MTSIIFPSVPNPRILLSSQFSGSGSTETFLPNNAAVSVVRILARLKAASVVTPNNSCYLKFQNNGNTNFDTLYNGINDPVPSALLVRNINNAIGLNFPSLMGNNAAPIEMSFLDLTIYNWLNPAQKFGFGTMITYAPSLSVRTAYNFSFQDLSLFPYTGLYFNAGAGLWDTNSVVEMWQLE